MSGSKSPNQSHALRLIALGAASPQACELGRRRITVGAAADNDLVLNEPTASRQHAALERRWGRWRVVDLGSTNGTYLNGRRVVGPTRVARGDELRFGDARFACVAPGDDLSQVGAGRGRNAAPARRPASRGARAVATLLLFAGGGFALTAYVLHVEHRVGRGAEGAATRSAAAPSAAASVAREPDGAGGGETVPSARGAVAPGTPADAPGAAAPPAWLARLNHYRVLERLAPVDEHPALSEADAMHARYLVKTYAEGIRHSSLGGEAHEENSSSPWYTDAGAKAGKSSDVSYWQAAKGLPPGATPSDSPDSPAEMLWGSEGWSIDGWAGIPFHRLSLINPYLQRSGFGRYCEASVCAAGLDTLSDRKRQPQYPVPFPHPLEFPPSGATIGILSLDSEWPDPLTGCPGYVRPAGLAITLEVGANVDAKLGAYRLVREGASPAGLEACGFDASSYVNPEPGAQQRARDLMRAFGAVVLIPRVPLEKGATYTVAMTVNGEEYRWSFATPP
ncbi:MAG TPA: FHA domain-containing protein [Candidatus Binataceae bacterium]